MGINVEETLKKVVDDDESIFSTEEDMVRLLKATPTAIEMGIHDLRWGRSDYQAALRKIAERLQWGPTGPGGESYPVRVADLIVDGTDFLPKILDDPKRLTKLTGMASKVLSEAETDVDAVLRLAGQEAEGLGMDILGAAEGFADVVSQIKNHVSEDVSSWKSEFEEIASHVEAIAAKCDVSNFLPDFRRSDWDLAESILKALPDELADLAKRALPISELQKLKAHLGDIVNGLEGRPSVLEDADFDLSGDDIKKIKIAIPICNFIGNLAVRLGAAFPVSITVQGEADGKAGIKCSGGAAAGIAALIGATGGGGIGLGVISNIVCICEFIAMAVAVLMQLVVTVLNVVLVVHAS